MLDCMSDQATVDQQALSWNLKSVSPGEHPLPPHWSLTPRAASGTVQDVSSDDHRLTNELSFGFTRVLLWPPAALLPAGVSPHVSQL